MKYFKFVVLPFGLATGPYIFTKAMRPFVNAGGLPPVKLLFI